MKKPTVSIVIPYYNGGPFIKETISSIKNQSFTDFEVIIVNDGSTERKSIRVLSSLNCTNLRIFHTKNSGLSAARNYGIRRAKGRFIMPVDADDKLHRKYLEKTVSLLRKSKAGYVYTDARMFGSSNRVWRTQKFDIKKLLRYNYVPAWSIMKKEVWTDVGGYDEELRKGGEDWDFWLSAFEKKWSGEQLPEPLYLYRIHENNMSKHILRRMPELVAYIRKKHKQLYTKYPISRNPLLNVGLEALMDWYYSRKRYIPVFLRETGKKVLSIIK